MSTRNRPTTPAADGAVILSQLHHALTRYVILPSSEAAVAVVLWIAATHAQAAWQHAPRLVIRAPEKRCGKSRLLDIVEGTSPRPADHRQRLTRSCLPGNRHRHPAHPAGG